MDARRAALKQSMSEFVNVYTRMSWLVLGEQSVFGTLARDQWQAYLPNIRITAKAALTFNTWTNMRITNWRMESDDVTAPVSIDESVEILVSAIVETLDRSAKSAARLQLLEDALQGGLHIVRAHCRANRSAMRDEHVVIRFLTFIDEDFRLSTNAWMRAAMAVKAAHVIPPELPKHFPAVPVSNFPATRGYINMGGMGNAALFRFSAASSVTSPTKKMRVGGFSLGGNSPRPSGAFHRRTERYCFYFNSPSGCDDPECQYLHEEHLEAVARAGAQRGAHGKEAVSGEEVPEAASTVTDEAPARAGGGDSDAASSSGGSGAVGGTTPATHRSGGARRRASSFFGPKRDK